MVGGSDRDLRRELKQMRDDASRTLAARLERSGRESKFQGEV